MPASRAKRGKEWAWEMLETSRPVKASEVTRDGTLQVRSKMIPSLSSKYAHEMQAGALFPPVELGEVKGRLYLLDGWHRYDAAVLINGQEVIEAVIRPMSLAEATWAAASANLTQGQGLTSKDKRNVLAAYIKARKHRVGKTGLKSYRDIGKELAIKLGSLYRWIKEDHPKLFKAMQGESPDKPPAEAPAPPDLAPEHLRRASHALEEARHCFDSLRQPEDRFEVIEEVKRLLETMQQKEHYEADW